MISIIVARSKNNVIGNAGEIPWKIPEDMKHFKNITTDGIVIMGRKTYESIGKPLKNRINIVVSKTKKKEFGEHGIPMEGAIGVIYRDVVYCDSLEDAIQTAKEHYAGKEIYLIGGNSIYKEGMKYAEKMYITEINKEYDGDVFFPSFNEKKYIPTIIGTGHTIDEITHEYIKYMFVEYMKI